MIPISDYNLKTDIIEALMNMKVTGGTFKIDRGGAALDVSGGLSSRIRWVKLITDLPAVSNSGEFGAVTTTANFFGSSSGGNGGSMSILEDGQPVTVVNRSKIFSAKANDLILVAQVDVATGTEWQPIIPAIVSEPEDGSGSNPPDVLTCTNCKCIDGRSIPDGTVCCEGALVWEMTDPWVGTTRVLSYAGSDTWISDEFDGPACSCIDGGGCNCFGDPDVTCNNTFRWVLTPSLTPGASSLELEIVTDNGCDSACITYTCLSGWQCKCGNTMVLSSNWTGIGSRYPKCSVCLVPRSRAGGFLEGAEWSNDSGICGVSADDLPTVWAVSYSSAQGGTYGFGGVGGSRIPTVLAKYSGSVSIVSPFATTIADIFIDTNVLKETPLVRQGNRPSAGWGSPSVAEEGTRSGIPVGVLFCSDCVAGGFGFYTVLSRAVANISCSGTSSGGSYSVTVTCSVPMIAYLEWPLGHAQFVPQYTTTYSYTYTDLELHEIPCVINQEHTLYRAGGLYGTEDTEVPATIATGGVHPPAWDPQLEDLFLPGSVTLSPFGGGPNDCPNPPLEGIPSGGDPDNSGACGGCTPPDSGGADPDDGACCVNGECLPYTTESLCTDLEGDFYNNSAECADSCRVTACCVNQDEETATCTDGLTQTECVGLGGVWTENLSCASSLCTVDVGGRTNTLVYYVDGTWTVPSGVTSARVYVWGAGGAGSYNSGGGDGEGGGGGGFGYKLVTVTPGVTEDIVVGVGGTAFLGGTDGSVSYFRSTATVAGYGGSSGGNGGTGGTGVGDLTRTGGAGGTNPGTGGSGGGGGGVGGINGNGGPGGAAGGASGGLGGNSGGVLEGIGGINGGDGGTGGTGASGQAGFLPGGGGGGGSAGNSGSAGADGVVIIYY